MHVLVKLGCVGDVEAQGALALQISQCSTLLWSELRDDSLIHAHTRIFGFDSKKAKSGAFWDVQSRHYFQAQDCLHMILHRSFWYNTYACTEFWGQILPWLSVGQGVQMLDTSPANSRRMTLIHAIGLSWLKIISTMRNVTTALNTLKCGSYVNRCCTWPACFNRMHILVPSTQWKISC